MADEIQLKVSADIKEVNSAITATKKFEKQITNTVKALNAGKITNKAYNQSLLEIKRGYQEYSTSSQKATADVRKMANAIKEAENAAKQQELAKAAIKNTQELNRLKMGYDKVYAAEQKRLRLKKLLRAEVAAGNMTLREAGRELLLYRQRLNEMSQGFQFAKNRANKFGMVAQQVGYQVGDFFVQVQSGASALVAFGQQGTQLAGLLPGIYGAIVGIGLSLGTMLVKGFMDASGASQTLSEALDELGSSSSAVMASFEKLNDENLNETFGDLNPTIKKLEARFLALNSAAELRNLINVLDKLKESSEIGFGSRMLEAFKRGGTREDLAPEMFTKKYGFSVGKEIFDDLVDGMIAQAKSGDVKGVVKAFEDLVSQAAIVPKDVTLEGIALLNETKVAALGVAETYAAIGGSAEASVIDNDALEEHAAEMEAFYDMIAKEDKDEAKRKSDLMKKQWDALYKNRMEAKKAAEEASKREATAIANSQVQIEQASVKQELQEAELKYGSKSIEHREAQVKAAKELARITAEQKFIADGITDAEQDQIDLLVEAAGEAEVMKQALADSKVEAQDLARALKAVEASMDRLTNIGAGVDKRIAIVRAEAEALQEGKGLTGSRTAGVIAGITAEIESSFKATNEAAQAAYDLATKKIMVTVGQGSSQFEMLTDVDPSVERAARATRDAALEKARDLRQERITGFEGGLPTLEYFLNEKARLEELERSEGKSGKDKKKPGLIMTEELFSMKQKLDLQEASLGKSKEEILFEKNKSRLLSKITDQMVGMSEVDKAFYIQQAEGAAEYITNKQLELIALQKIEQQQEDAAVAIANSFGSAMTSIVDGTKSVKDAFKDMARAIIAELYQIYVVKQITGMISRAISPYVPTFIPSKNGNVFSNGNLVPYADGGVVGGPTYFPMNDGRTGLMGEAGPEAIMPLKRGKDGKLGVQAEGGSSGDVIIHQNFNFQANGDESVKKIIAQQAPAIANMTKKQILDDRRRGGQMKQAFG